MKYLAPICRGLLVQPWQVIPFSSEDGTGKEELLNKIEQVCYAEEEQDDAAGEPTPRSRTETRSLAYPIIGLTVKIKSGALHP